MPGPPPVVTTKRWRLPDRVRVQVGEQEGQAARVLVVVGHVHGALGAMRFLLMSGSGLHGAGAGEQFDSLFGAAETAEAGGAEEDHRVLNFFAAETGQRLGVFGEDAQGAAIRAFEESVVFVRQGNAGGFVFCLVRHKKSASPGS